MYDEKTHHPSESLCKPEENSMKSDALAWSEFSTGWKTIVESEDRHKLDKQ